MILNAIKYIRHTGEPREWGIVGREQDYAYFGNINLLVGKNASGKSRTLNVIREIAGLFSGQMELKDTISHSEYYELIFTDKNCKYKYILEFKNRIIIDEVLTANNKVLINRNKKTLKDNEGNDIPYNIEDSQLLITIQKNEHFYYEDFVLWGQSLKNYLFANQVQKSRLVKDYIRINEKGLEETGNPDMLIHTFYKGKELFGNAFTSEVISGMNELGHNISDISIEETKGLYGLAVEEQGEYIVSQKDMSQGMFRAISLLIMLTYARLNDISVCLLIDDMGEGLDFETSKKMMNIIIKNLNKSSIQFFTTTNDRYVMNQIPLRFWSVIERKGTKSIFYDYTNSKDTFDDFKYTGLNNFDFLVTDFYKNGFGVIDEEDND